MKHPYPVLILLTAAAVLAIGLIWLFELRYQVGDVYPAYSSLRSDPLGTMAFYESIEGLPGFAVSRDISERNLLPEGNGVTYFYIAFPSGEWRSLPEETLQDIERFAAGGGRFVLTTFPVGAKSFRQIEEKDTKKEKPKPTPVRDRWGADFDIINLEAQRHEYKPAVVDNKSALQLPPALQWHSGVVATNVNAGWQTIYARGSSPVIIERQIGRGSIVIATDSYFLSNEAMQGDRHADLLAWLIGSNRTVIFEEAHLGVTETAGMATLMRRYRLHWFVEGLIVLAALFIWKNSSSLVPAGTGMKFDYIAGKDSTAGFINLLRRGIPSRDVLALCFTEWKTAMVNTASISPQRMDEVHKIFEAENARPAKDRNPVQAYQDISRILNRKIK
jgi:Domain of unknown function (DUF4350)